MLAESSDEERSLTIADDDDDNPTKPQGGSSRGKAKEEWVRSGAEMWKEGAAGS